MAADSVQLRFRSTLGDIGPFPFNDSVLIQAVKEKLLAEWPTGVHKEASPLLELHGPSHNRLPLG
jgi:hypothetical protein